jgi:LmbE family N-acetylglucosaminyl deacetylase
MRIAETMAKHMSNTPFTLRDNPVVLALGPHADDIELGCGATLLRLKKCFGAVVHYVVFSDHFSLPKMQERREEIESSSRMLGVNTFECDTYEDAEFPNSWNVIQTRIAALLEMHKPTLVFAPREDNHQDHVVVAQAARREVRKGQALLQYEIKQFGQEQFQPVIYIDVSQPSRCKDRGYLKFLQEIGGKDTFAHRKVYILQKCMTSQSNKAFLNLELLLGTMRFRGMQVSPDVEYAEAFKGTVLL